MFLILFFPLIIACDTSTCDSGNNNSRLIEKSISVFLSFIFRSRTIYLALRSLREIGFISSQEKSGMKLGNKMKSQPSSVKTLADMLKELNNDNLIKREAFNEIPPIVDYTLIEDCEKFREAILPILVWASFLDTKEKV